MIFHVAFIKIHFFPLHNVRLYTFFLFRGKMLQEGHMAGLAYGIIQSS